MTYEEELEMTAQEEYGKEFDDLDDYQRNVVKDIVPTFEDIEYDWQEKHNRI